MDETWMPDEIAHAGPEHLDPGFVAGYDRKQGTDPADAVAILRRYGLGQESTLVDLAAGTGTLTVAAAPWCRQVIAVDVSPVLAGFLRERAEAGGCSSRCWRPPGFRIAEAEFWARTYGSYVCVRD